MRALVLLAFLASPALAEEPLTMEFRNQSSRPAIISGIFELRPDGTSIDDNLGSSDVFGPGETITVQTALIRCTTVEIFAWLGPLAAEDREEIRGETDLCQNRVMILHD
jgi:hypothetical protein